MTKQSVEAFQEQTADICLFGGFSLAWHGATLTDEATRSQKLLSVLSYLILHRGRNVPQTELIDVFWSDDEESGNPINALKTLIYRIRAMLEPVFGENPRPILSRRGGYAWNPEIPCEVDVEQFKTLCERAAGEKSTESKIELYSKAIALYRGDLLPKLSGQFWLIPLATLYHNQYLDAVKKLAGLYFDTECYEEMAQLCAVASGRDPLDEQLHILLVRSLLRQGKNAAALAQYELATETLYRSLGVRPSEELRALYTEIMSIKKELETDLEIIQRDLRETAARGGAFLCEYGFFREIYRLEARRAKRSGVCVHVCLITVTQRDGTMPELKLLGDVMERLSGVLFNSLRRGDVVSQYSAAQFVVLLLSANYEDSDMVMERIVDTYYRHYRRSPVKLTYKVREVELD